MSTDVQSHANLVWSIAELLRGDYKRSEYGRVILPLVVLRRLDQALEPTKDAVVARSQELKAQGIENRALALTHMVDGQFYNDSPLTLPKLLHDAPQVGTNLRALLRGFSPLAQEVFAKFEIDTQIARLERAGLLYAVLGRIRDVDLSPQTVSNLEMGYLFEELVRKFAEASNETAGEHFTPREVVRLMVHLLVGDDAASLSAGAGTMRTVFDCACGTGGMLTEADAQIHALNPKAQVDLFGQELNDESYAICLADMLVKGRNASNVVSGNSLSADGHAGQRFDYLIANPPFGVDWSKIEKAVRDEHADEGAAGRFGPGLPRKSDGQLLFLMHLLAKMKDPAKGGSRMAIVHNGSPLFTGQAGSGESEIRRHLIEHDLLEAIVALPEQLFYNTGIASYVWVLSNHKRPERRGRVQLIDARESYVRMRRSLGEKRREIGAEQIDEIARLHGAFAEGDERVKIVDGRSFGYRTIVVEQPLRGAWVLDPATWAELPDVKALAKLDDEQRRTVTAALAGLGHETLHDQQEVTRRVRAAITGAGLRAPTASVLRALVAHCLVRDPDGPVLGDADGDPLPDPDRRDTENVPLDEDVEAYLEREVRPHVPGAWCPAPEGKVGYEIPFTRLFYRYVPPRPVEEIKAELKELEGEIHRLLAEVVR